jgi:hypothetical protein
MSTRSLAGRRGLAVADPVILISVATVAAGLLAAGCTPILSSSDAAWSRYRQAKQVYEDCLKGGRQPPCGSEKATYKQALESYRAGAGAVPPTAP